MSKREAQEQGRAVAGAIDQAHLTAVAVELTRQRRLLETHLDRDDPVSLERYAEARAREQHALDELAAFVAGRRT
jgi:hypothetical protein